MAERILLEQLNQMRRLNAEMRDMLHNAAADSEPLARPLAPSPEYADYATGAALAANMTRRAQALEAEIRMLQQRLAESETIIATTQRQGAANLANANARAAAAEKEAEAVREKLKLIDAELDAVKKELVRAKKLLADKRPSTRPAYRDPSRTPHNMQKKTSDSASSHRPSPPPRYPSQ